MEKVDDSFTEFSGRFKNLLDEFKNSYGYAYDGATIRRTSTLIEILQRKAIMSYAPRHHFLELAKQQKHTKTPPGFKDDGDGDFFIWVDMLISLIKAKNKGIHYSRAFSDQIASYPAAVK